MRCVHPTCNSQSDTLSKDIAFHSIPSKPSIRAIWLKLLHTEPSEVDEDGAVCSRHFLKADLYHDKAGVCRIRAGALPIVNLQHNVPDSSIVKICRICFAADRKLYKMTDYNNLDKAYNIITGLSLENNDNIPPYLCSQCAQRLLNCVHFRTRSLRAHLILLEVVKKHKNVTLQSVKAVIGVKGQRGSNLEIKETSNFDLVINHDAEGSSDDDMDVTDDPDLKMEVNDDFCENEPEVHESNLTGLHENVIKDDSDNSNLVILDENDIKEDSDESDKQDDDDAIRYSPTNIVFDDLEEEDEASDEEPIGKKGDDENSNAVKSDSECVMESDEEHIMVKIPDFEKIDRMKQVPSKSDTKNNLENYRRLADKLIIKPGCTKRPIPVKIVKVWGRPSTTMIKSIDKTLYQTVDDVPSSGEKKGICKPYSCRYCDFDTILKRELNSHRKVCKVRSKMEENSNKTKELLYKCKDCDNRFRFSYELQFHEQSHTRKKPFRCDVCKKRFNFETSLNFHARKMHPNAVVNKLLYEMKIKGNPVTLKTQESK